MPKSHKNIIDIYENRFSGKMTLDAKALSRIAERFISQQKANDALDSRSTIYRANEREI